ncbi:MAG: ABC transporter permease subunit, partial [Actinomycetota bacterium]
TGAVVLGVFLWGAFSVGDIVVGLDVGPARLGVLVLNAMLLGLVFGTLALAIGCASGSRGLAIAGATSVAAATYLLSAFARLVEGLEPLTYASPWRYYDPQEVLLRGLDPADVVILAGLIVVFSATSLVAFDARDVGT